jgi:phosphoribosyl-AMP cyclohydrolase / phosphoribosyl-ATP pyrophosphohydrolase
VESEIRWDVQGLVPVIAQDAATRDVLMLAYANAEALAKTLETGEAYYYSRSRQALWRKGETSGNTQRVLEVRYDCDADALLYWVEPRGPACHTGERSCFYRCLAQLADAPSAWGLKELEALIRNRQEHPQPGSYTCSLFAAGENRILKKVAEEAVEVVIAVKGEGRERTISESADLLYHVLVLLRQQGIALGEVEAELAHRHGNSGSRQPSDKGS